MAPAEALCTQACNRTRNPAGSGSRLVAYHTHTGKQLLNQVLLPGTRIHGVTLQRPTHPGGQLLAVHGGRHLALATLQLSDSNQAGLSHDSESDITCSKVPQKAPRSLQLSVHAVHQPGRQWILAATFMPAAASTRIQLAVGLIDNSVEVWTYLPAEGQWQRGCQVRAACSVRLLLYCMALSVPVRAGKGRTKLETDPRAELGTEDITRGQADETAERDAPGAAQSGPPGAGERHRPVAAELDEQSAATSAASREQLGAEVGAESAAVAGAAHILVASGVPPRPAVRTIHILFVLLRTRRNEYKRC